VYSGNKKASVSNGIDSASSDHMVEQLLPDQNWGKYFILTPMPYSTNPMEGRMGQRLERYKFIASEAGTTITIKNFNPSGVQIGTDTVLNLQAGSYENVEHQRGSYSVVTSNKVNMY
jgi:hypothetical protein